MGLIDDKKSVFNEIGALNSARDTENIPNQNNSLNSINNSREIVPFLLELLVILIGSQVLKRLTGELLTNLLLKVEPILKAELQRQTTDYNSLDILPAYFSSGGIRVPVKEIDLYGKYRTDPTSQLGGLLYTTNSNDFDRVSFDAIQVASTPNTFNNLRIEYSQALDQFVYKPTNPANTIGSWTSSYINGLNIVNQKEFIANIINIIFGVVSSNQNKTQEQLIKEEKINRVINKLIDEEDDLNISNQELRDIERSAENKKNGIETVDVGCGLLVNTVTLNSLEDTINEIVNTTNPVVAGDAISNMVSDGFPEDDSRGVENKETVEDGFFKRLIDAIVTVLVLAVTTTPQIRALFAITNAFKENGSVGFDDIVNDLSRRRNLVNCLSKTVKSEINEFIFNLAKKEILALVIPVSKLILREKITQYIAILRSLAF